MKYLLLICVVLTVVFLTGCSAFEPQRLERKVCPSASTPYANDTKKQEDGLYWYVNKTGWHSKAVNPGDICETIVWTANR